MTTIAADTLDRMTERLQATVAGQTEDPEHLLEVLISAWEEMHRHAPKLPEGYLISRNEDGGRVELAVFSPDGRHLASVHVRPWAGGWCVQTPPGGTVPTGGRLRSADEAQAIACAILGAARVARLRAAQ